MDAENKSHTKTAVSEMQLKQTMQPKQTAQPISQQPMKPKQTTQQTMKQTMQLKQTAQQTTQQTILVLDDEVAIADLVSNTFNAEGIATRTFYSAFEALKALNYTHFDLAIVDVMMPGMDGFEFCRRLREISDIPVIFLTAKDEETDVVIGFAIGADDYVTKPFKPRELVARVKARLRRQAALSNTGASHASQQYCGENNVLRAMGIEVHPKTHKASLHDIPLSLTPKEFDILAMLLERKGEPISAKELYEACWHEESNAQSVNTIMVHIRHLRCKLAEVDSSKTFVETVWGVGYCIGDDHDAG